MDILTFVSEIVTAIVWPIAILIIILLLRKPIANLIPNIIQLRYKEFEIHFTQTINKMKAEMPREMSKETEHMKIDSEFERDPVQAVLSSWENIEESIFNKLKELLPKDDTRYSRLSKKHAYHEISLTGVLIPSMKDLLQDLYGLRNSLLQRPKNSISNENAKEYVKLARFFKNYIDNLREIPEALLSPLTLLILHVNHLIDTKKYDHITLDNIKREIANENVLPYLEEVAKEDIDLSIYLKRDTYHGFVKFYNERLYNLYNAYSGDEMRKWGIENSGLCLLLAWTNEIVQQGSGWHPAK